MIKPLFQNFYKNCFLLLLGILLLNNCSSEKEGNMSVVGTIKGLKKGTLYLQKIQDTALIAVDSVKIYDKNTFLLKDNVEIPELYYLTLDKNNSIESIPFFGEAGTITINTDVDYFKASATVTGLENQKIYQDYLNTSKRFTNQNLDFIKKEFDYKKDNKLDSLALLNKQYNNFIKRKYLYTANYALNNNSSVVAPYLAITELNNASTKLLDTIYKSLKGKAKQSVYSKELAKMINNRDAN